MSSVVLSSLYTAISTAIYDELLTKQSTLYSFIGKTTDFASVDESQVRDNLQYDYFIKNNIAFAKKINMSDISYVAPRYNWASGTVYDQYDDNYYGSSITSVNVITGGSGYVAGTTSAYATGGGGGYGVELTVDIIDGAINAIGVLDGGRRFTSVPDITITGDGVGATATANISANNLSYSGKPVLSASMFYIITSEYNVYKCIYNNLNAPSTVQPSHLTVDPLTTADGYVWKFMYHIPLGLRKKFLTSSFMPVFNVLSSSYYSNGGISAVTVLDGGTGYTTATPLTLYPVSDGIGATFSAEINSTAKEIASVAVLTSGTGYEPTVTKSIESISRSLTTVTLTTTSAHNLVIGKSITVSGTGLVDGTVTVISVPSSNSITYTLGSGTISLTTFGTTGFATNAAINLASLVRNNNVVTAISAANHNLNEGNLFTVAGATGFNGTFKVAKYISPTSFSFFQFGAPATLSSTGTFTQAQIGVADIVRATNVVTVTTQDVHNFKGPLTIATITRATNITTVVTTAANTLLAGDTVIISGTVGFDGTYVIDTWVNSTTFTFANVGADTAEAVGNVNYAVVISNISGFSGTYPVASIVSSKSFTFAQAGADYSAYTASNVAFSTSIGISSNVGVSGKYNGNTSAIITPSLLVKGGIGYTVPPTVYIGGTSGAGATADASITGGKVTTINVTANGSGYISEPVVYLNGGSPNQATATANIVGGEITSYSVVNNGLGYQDAPLVRIVGDGTGATATAIIGSGGVISVNVVNPGTGYTTATVYFAGGSDYVCSARAIVYNNTVDSIKIDNIIDTISITDPGVGYVDGISTTISITGDGVGAALTPYIRDGSVVGAVIDNPGEGYTYADLTVTGDGTGAKLTTSLDITNVYGQVDTSQYNVEVLAVPGAISSIIVTNGGSGYTTPTVTITGNGTGATADAVVVGGVITKILITNRGYGYSYANVTISGGGAATARAVLPPIGGHGFNAVVELYATKLIMYTKISDSDIYNNFTFSNQFYQYGIIANPRKYNSGAVCTDTVISPCVAVDGTFNLADFPLNAIVSITVSGSPKTFDVVDRTAASLLLRSIDSYIPVVGDVLTNIGNSISYTATAVTLPTTNINTGNIIDVNNTTAFYKTPSQIITLRTLISL